MTPLPTSLFYSSEPTPTLVLFHIKAIKNEKTPQQSQNEIVQTNGRSSPHPHPPRSAILRSVSEVAGRFDVVFLDVPGQEGWGCVTGLEASLGSLGSGGRSRPLGLHCTDRAKGAVGFCWY